MNPHFNPTRHSHRDTAGPEDGFRETAARRLGMPVPKPIRWALITTTALCLFAQAGAPSVQAAALSRPSWIRPANQGAGVAQPLVLEWQPVPGAVRYEYELYRGDRPNQRVHTGRFTRATSVMIDTAQPGTRYLARVRAHAEKAGDPNVVVGRWSPTHFTTAVGEAGPILLEPTDGEHLVPTSGKVRLTWAKVSWAARYWVCYWNATTDPVTVVVPAAAQPFRVIDVDRARVTHWKVCAIGNGGAQGLWSSEQIFGNTPVDPSPVYPRAGQIVSARRPVFSWSAASITTGHEFELRARASSDEGPLVELSTSQKRYELDRDLEPLTPYSWRVCSEYPDGISDYTETDFTTGVWGPTLVFPGVGDSFKRKTPVTFEWERLAHVVSAQIKFNKNFQPGQKVYPEVGIPGNTVTVPALMPGIYEWSVVVTFDNGQQATSPTRRINITQY